MTMRLLVASKERIATDIYRFELVRNAQEAGQDLPAFTAGAHITVLTPNGLTRRYSLCNAPQEHQRYVMAVKRENAGLGGSANLVDSVHVGDMLPVVAGPLNYFELAPNARQHLLIAGGIGITPLLSMAQALLESGAKFRLLYLSRNKESAAFLSEINTFGVVHFDEGDPAKSFNLQTLLAQQGSSEHLYCCGPRALMQAVREHAKHWSAGSVHFEDFGSSEPLPAAAATGGDSAFEVRLKKTGVTVIVPLGVSILEALRIQGVSVPSSCESGTCGTCRTPLLSGEVDHRDYVLDEDEQKTEIIICVSRAKTGPLELDI